MSIGILQVALDALRANKVRAFLTILGIVIGSACIVLVVTISLVGRQYIVSQIEGVGSNIVYGELVHTQRQTALSDDISLSDIDALRGIPGVVHTAGTHEIQMTVVVGSVEHPVNMVAVTAEFQAIRNLLVLQGRYLDDSDFQSRSKVCLLTEELARSAFLGSDPVGRNLRVGELQFTIIGVFKERIATFGQSEIARESVIVPFGLLKSLTGTEAVSVLYAQAATPDLVPSVTAQVGEVLRARHRPGAKYDVQNLSAILDAARTISSSLTMVLLAVSLMTLIVSGVGIMNIMLVTVTERTREIGIRKAVGAHERQILYPFLMEALIISGVGATIGIGIAVGIPMIVQPFLPDGLEIPVSGGAALLAFIVSCAIGIIFGYLPARRAAKLQPVEALRYE